jgi:hypothetical protein
MTGALQSEQFLSFFDRGSEVDVSLTFHDQSGCSSAFPLTTDVLALL